MVHKGAQLKKIIFCIVFLELYGGEKKMNIRERLTDTFGTRSSKTATDAPDFLYYWGFDPDTDEIVFHYGYL